METVAIYREERIRTYGFDLKTDLTLITLVVSPTDQGAVARALDQLGKAGFSYELLTAHASETGGCGFSFLTGASNATSMTELLQKAAPGILEISQESSLELLHFQGPHFGDRYGIVDAAVDALTTAEIEPIAVCCAGSSIYMVLPANSGREAIRILSTPFQTPDREKG